jgi:hypothetical protein
MTTEGDVNEILRQLEIILKQRAKTRGLIPGSKPYLSYLCGTMDRERKRLMLAQQKRKPSTRESARRD